MANAKKPTSKRKTPKTKTKPVAAVVEDTTVDAVQEAVFEEQSAVDQSVPVADDVIEDADISDERDAVDASAVAAEAEQSAPEGSEPLDQTTDETSERKGGVVLPLVFGGVIAGVLGFFAAELNVLGTRGEDAGLRAEMQQQAAVIAQIQSDLATPVAAAGVDLTGIETQLADLGAALSEVQARVDELAARPTLVENPGATAEVAALQDLQASVAAQKQEIEALLQDAKTVEEATADAARLAVAQSAVTQISNAAAAGTGFEDALTALGESGVSDIPAALQDYAGGVASLASLQTSFPVAARASLASVRAQDGGQASGFGDFLKRQLGARSVAPRAGSDPDAILSRAEAALREGRLATALSEIDALPPVAVDAMSAWLSEARARSAVETALDDLSQRLSAN